MEIHPLDPQAFDDYRAMLDLFGAVFEDPDSYCTRQPDDDYIGRLLANEHFLALVAKVDGRIVGALAGYVLPTRVRHFAALRPSPIPYESRTWHGLPQISVV